MGLQCDFVSCVPEYTFPRSGNQDASHYFVWRQTQQMKWFCSVILPAVGFAIYSPSKNK
jgi:hypothetical protein